MANKKYERGIHELYAEDPERADRVIFGRSAGTTRRGFLTQSSLLAVAAVVGARIPFARHFPEGLMPAALAATGEDFVLPGKEGLVVLNDRPINAETPAHLLDDAVTPANRMFVRNNGIPPDVKTIDPDKWMLSIEGEACERPTRFSLKDLKTKFKPQRYQLQVECAGNGRSEFQPPAKGSQWTTGAVACPNWTGVRLADVLKQCGIKSNAVYVGFYAADTDIGQTGKVPISRGVPMAKALEDETLIAWAMNDQAIPHLHGYPLRLVCGGWPGSASGKWLIRLAVRDKIHDGPKMGGHSYRVPCQPVAPGSVVPEADMCIIESMPVKSLITHPKSGIVHKLADTLSLRGHAWAGDLLVKESFVSIDFGTTWIKTGLTRPKNRLAWQHWDAQVKFGAKGYYEIWARAVDERGVSQPMVLPGWNPEGYLNNSCHRIAVQVV